MTTIDFRTMPANVPSLCIPRVFPNIDERRIRGIFDTLNMGEIARVDIIPRKTEKGENFNRVFIHWKRWNDSENANNSRERLLNGKEIKIIYDDPWFWKISAYREATNSRPNARPLARPLPAAPRLEFDAPIQRNARSPVRRPIQRNDQRDNRSPVRRPIQRPIQRDNRRPIQRNDQRPRSPVRRPIHPEVAAIEPSTPNCTPPRAERPTSDFYGDEEREQVPTNVPEPMKLDYSGLPEPPKKLNFKVKSVVIEDDVEVKEEE
jgi:hypothetical protein